jgi:hypothetical protein
MAATIDMHCWCPSPCQVGENIACNRHARRPRMALFPALAIGHYEVGS